MNNKKNAIVHLISLGILCAGFVLTRYHSYQEVGRIKEEWVYE